MKLPHTATASISELTSKLNVPATTVFKQSENMQDCFNLYVNGQKTNICYFTKPMLFMSATQQREDAMQAEHFIKEGKVYPSEGNWKGFDLCTSCMFTIHQMTRLYNPCEWHNALTSVLTPYRIQPEQHPAIIQKWTGRTVNTQFSKRIVQDQISDSIGIYIDHYGYSLYFI